MNLSPEELFALSDDEEMFRQELHNQLAKDPLFQEIVAKAEKLRDFDRDLFWEAFRYFKDAGFTAYGVPDEFGGTAISSRASVMLTDEICQHDGSIGLSLGATASLVANPLDLFGTTRQREKWLPKIAQGQILACYCQSEPEAGSDIASIKTTAVKRGDHWIINGPKHFITNGSEAHLALVIARIGPHPYKGLAVFVVDLEQGKKTGQITILRNEHKAGLHLSPTTAMSFDNCVADSVLGTIEEDDPKFGTYSPGAWSIINATLAGSRASAIPAQGLGVVRGALREAKIAVSQRKQFGSKILGFPAQRTRILRIEAALKMGELLTWRAALLRDKLGKQDSRPWQAEASMAKLWCSELAEWGTSEAMQLAAGIGYTNPKIYKFWLDGRIVKIYEGTSEVQEMIIAGETLRRAFGGAPTLGASVLEQETASLLAAAWKHFPFDPKTAKTLPAVYFPVAQAIAAVSGAVLVAQEFAWRGINDPRYGAENLVPCAELLAQEQVSKAKLFLEKMISDPVLRRAIEGTA